MNNIVRVGQSSTTRDRCDSPPGHDPERDKAGCAAILKYFRDELFRDLPDARCPSTAELTRDGRFGLRPPNRINDLVRGKYDGHHYDFERIRYGRGEYRWRLHEPARPGCPKNKGQELIPWDERPRALTNKQGHPLPPEDSPLFASARDIEVASRG
jgi:hypothetical protein